MYQILFILFIFWIFSGWKLPIYNYKEKECKCKCPQITPIGTNGDTHSIEVVKFQPLETHFDSMFNDNGPWINQFALNSI